MATNRMISDLVIESDNFLELPLSAQALYMHLVLRCDNEGFTASSVNAIRSCGATAEDLETLEKAGFVLRFKGTPTICIAHWQMMNKLKKDVSKFPEKKLVRLNGGVYEMRDANEREEEWI